MKNEKRRLRVERIIDGFFCAAAIALIVGGVIALGTWLAVRATAAELETPEVKYFTDEETDMLAKTVWGEARGCSDIQQEAVVWCVLNRVDDPRFPDSIESVINQKNEFFGFDASNPVGEDIRALVKKVLLVWATEGIMPAEGKERVLPREYVFFSGDGYQNIFTTGYLCGEVWNWSGVVEAECLPGVGIAGC